jgi:hypothetical protein
MIKIALTFLLVLFISMTVKPQLSLTSDLPIKLGRTSINIKQFYNGLNKNILFLNVHQDEITSIDAIQDFGREIPINFAYIHHKGTRRIDFVIGKQIFSIDPNRIFTTKGRKETILPKKPFFLKATLIAKKLAKKLIFEIKKFNVVVTLHNNSDVNYSIKSYLPGGDEAQNTLDVFINPNMDPDDFIYTTEKKYFNYLKAENYNVILQNNHHFINDGSLSVYCGVNQIPYINIEAQLGHYKEQLKLIKVVYEMLNA